MPGRNPFHLSIAMTLFLSGSVIAADDIQRMTGKDSGNPAAFTVNGPWMMEWSTVSEFPKFATFEMRLQNESTGEFLGTVAEIKGTGHGTKLFTDTGTFKLSIIATSSEWDIRIREVSEERAAAIKRGAEGNPTLLDAARSVGRFVPEGSFKSWRPEGNDTLLLFNQDGPRWRVSFSPPCQGLASATSISFLMSLSGSRDQYDSILLEDGTRCRFSSVSPTALP